MPRGVHKHLHKLDCQCASCLSKQGLTPKHKPDCQCSFCKSHRGEYKHTEETIQKMSLVRKGKTYEEIYGIEKAQETLRKKSLASTGENNPNWQGGITEQGYPFNFNNKLKELIGERDNYTCQLCGRTEEEEGRKLDVHHIDYIKENLDPNNLLTLCRNCNVKVNTNRSYWIEFFQLKLTTLNQENVN